MKQVF
jgi:hypothetical protein